MAAVPFTGGRIRERRLARGLKQSRLAELIGISAPYLNLIEHGRRGIGGALLNRVAAALDVDPQVLSRGTDPALLAAVIDAAAAEPAWHAETTRAEEFAARFPGWAGVVAEQGRRIARLEHTVEALNDRMVHDPRLAAALHEVLSAVTAIASASAILVDGVAVDPEWQARFQRNIHEDSRRLAGAAAGLVTWLDAAETPSGVLADPREAVDAWLAAQGHHFPELEDEGADAGAVLARSGAPTEPATRDLALRHLLQYRRDAAHWPLAPLARALADHGVEPSRLASAGTGDLASLLRRMAGLPREVTGTDVGLVTCDASGAPLRRKPLPGFPLPRAGAACPLLPLYRALSSPTAPVRARVEQTGRPPQRFLTFAIAQPAAVQDFLEPALFEATMLIVPDPLGTSDGSPVPVGTTCRVCPRTACRARREPSILSADPGPPDGIARFDSRPGGGP